MADVKQISRKYLVLITDEILDDEQMIAGLDKSRIEHRMPLCLFQEQQECSLITHEAEGAHILIRM